MLTHITVFNTKSDARHARLLPLVRSLLAQEVHSGLVLLLLTIFDVTLRCCNLRVANELLGLDYVFAIIVELGCLRCPEIVAFDCHTMPDKEPVDHQSPLVRWVTPISRREHELRVRRAHIILICFDGIDCLLINHDNARARFLSSDMQFEVAIFIFFELRNEAKSQANNILYAESTRVEESDEGEDFRRL